MIRNVLSAFTVSGQRAASPSSETAACRRAVSCDHLDVFTLDLPGPAVRTLGQSGIRVVEGSLGAPIPARVAQGYYPVSKNHNFPVGYQEANIVVVDLSVRPSAVPSMVKPPPDPHVQQFWVSAAYGEIDPRPLSALAVADDLARIRDAGGVFIVFPAPRLEREFALGCVRPQSLYYTVMGSEALQIDQTSSRSDWDCLSLPEVGWSVPPLTSHVANTLSVSPTSGKKITLASSRFAELDVLLRDSLIEAEFRCTIVPEGDALKAIWVPLAHNAFGDPVAGVLAPADARWRILFLPHFADKGQFLVRFLTEVLPEMSPHLFPEMQSTHWIASEACVLPGVAARQKTMKILEDETAAKLTTLRAEIDSIHQDYGFLHDLLTQSGDALVLAVGRTLELLGFRDVVDVDNTSPTYRREDLQVREAGRPPLLVEVTGIFGLPKETKLTKIETYMGRRKQEWNVTEIHGLCVVNHQRELPPLERENANPFQDDAIRQAESRDFGLITTWDLFQLARGLLEHRWDLGWVKPLFFQGGRIFPVPLHYTPIGQVERVYRAHGAITVTVTAEELRDRSRVAFLLPSGYAEEVIGSLQQDGKPVASVPQGKVAGIVSRMTREGLVVRGSQVYRVGT